MSRWEAAVGNVEDARVGFDVIARAIDGAVYLDEDAYSQVAPTAQFTKVIQVSNPTQEHSVANLMSLTQVGAIQAQQRKIADLERQLRETRFQLGESNAVQSEALQRHAEMQQELENNAGASQPPDSNLNWRKSEWHWVHLVLQQSAASSVCLAPCRSLFNVTQLCNGRSLVQSRVQLTECSACVAVVFKMHYQELLAKDEEIQKLTAVIQALSGR